MAAVLRTEYSRGKAGSRETDEEAGATVQTRDADSLEQDGIGRGSEKYSVLGYVLKVHWLELLLDQI